MNQEKTFFRFEDLRVYDKALDYIEWVIGATNAFPEDKGRVLSTRINNSALKIATYIAEGSARKKPQFIHNLKMAKSMVRECVVYTTVMDKEGYVSPEEIEVSRTHLMELTKMLGSLIGSLQRKSNGMQRDYNRQPEVENTFQDNNFEEKNPNEADFGEEEDFSQTI